MQDGMGLGNWTFALNDSDTPLAGKPMCSGSLFEFCKRQDDMVTLLFYFSFQPVSATLLAHRQRRRDGRARDLQDGTVVGEIGAAVHGGDSRLRRRVRAQSRRLPGRRGDRSLLPAILAL